MPGLLILRWPAVDLSLDLKQLHLVRRDQHHCLLDVVLPRLGRALSRTDVQLRRAGRAAPLGRSLREQAHVAQLRALHSQINPHFLFNSLNSVSALILDKESDKAEEWWSSWPTSCASD